MIICGGMTWTGQDQRQPLVWMRQVGLALLLLGLVVPRGAVGQTDPVGAAVERGQSAGVDPDLLQNVATRAEQRGLSADETVALLRPAIALAEQNLPAAPLLNKALEGLSKQVPPSRMSPVLTQIQSQTEKAGALVAEWLGQREVQEFVGASSDPLSEAARMELTTTIAEAQQQDLPLETARGFLDALPASIERRPVPIRDVAAAVSVMPNIPGMEDDPRAGLQLLAAALDAGYSSESMRQLPAALQNARRESQQPPGLLARGAAHAIVDGTPASNVLQSLFQGSFPGGGPPANVGQGLPNIPPGQGKPPGKEGNPPKGPPGQGPPDTGPPDTGPPDEGPPAGG